MHRLLVALLLMGLAPAPFGHEGRAWAQTVGSRESFNRIYKSAAFLGRGDTGIAVADNEDAIFYNPAGLAHGKGIYKTTVLASPMIEFSENTRSMVREIAADSDKAVDTVLDSVGKPNHVGMSNFTGIVLRRAAIGAVATANADLLAHKSPEQGGLEVIDASADQTIGLTFSLAEGFFNNSLLIGTTGKYLRRGRGELGVSTAETTEIKSKLDDRSQFLGSGEGLGADLGLMLKGGSSKIPLSLGLTVADVGDTAINPSEKTDIELDVKQTINAGAAIETGTKYSRARFLLDVRDLSGRVITNSRKKIHLGTELEVMGMAGVTGGLYQGYPTAGLYADLYVLRLDFGTYTQEISDRVGSRPDTRYYMRLRAGF